MQTSVRAQRTLALGLAVICGLAVGLAVTADRIYLAALLLIILLVVVMLKPAHLLLALIIGTPLFEIPSELLPQQHLSSVRDILLAMIAVVALGQALSEKDLRLPPRRLLAPLIIFGILVIGYIPLGPSLIQGLLGAKAVFFYAALALLVPFLVHRESQLRALLVGLSAVMTVMIGYALFSFIAPAAFFPYDPSGTGPQITDGFTRLHYGSFTVFFAQLAPVLWITAALVVRRRWLKIILVVTSALALALVAVAGLREAWLEALAAAAVFITWRRPGIAATVLGVSVAVGAVLILGADFVFVRLALTGASQDVGTTGRLSEIQSVWIPLVLSHPLGLGTGTFTSTASSTYQSIVGPLNFTYLNKGVGHNGYFEATAEFGVLGGAAYIWLIVAILREFLGNRRRLRSQLALGVNALALGVVISYCVMNLFTPALITFPANVYFFVCAGLAAALPQIEAADPQRNQAALEPPPGLQASPTAAGR
jgi:O-antigen ligase